MERKSVPPSINETAFDCPHCGAFTTQFWFEVTSKHLDDQQGTPSLPDEEWLKRITSDKDIAYRSPKFGGTSQIALSSGHE